MRKINRVDNLSYKSRILFFNIMYNEEITRTMTICQAKWHLVINVSTTLGLKFERFWWRSFRRSLTIGLRFLCTFPSLPLFSLSLSHVFFVFTFSRTLSTLCGEQSFSPGEKNFPWESGNVSRIFTGGSRWPNARNSNRFLWTTQMTPLVNGSGAKKGSSLR